MEIKIQLKSLFRITGMGSEDQLNETMSSIIAEANGCTVAELIDKYNGKTLQLHYKTYKIKRIDGEKV